MRKNLIWTAVGLAVIAGIYLAFLEMRRPGKLDEFAKCLGDKKAIFYGAFWCPHCQNQKSLFGRSQKYLPYIECSTADGQGQLQECRDKNITNYPTWEFSDKTRETGEVLLARLSEKTGCALPQ